jgi:quercetin dioxygenase-like cupin family protein
MKHVLLFLGLILLAGMLLLGSLIAGNKGGNMQVIKLRTDIGEGQNKQIEVLFEGPKRKLVQITLRHEAILESHSAPEPITIQYLSGKGTLVVGDKKETVQLEPGVLVTIEPNIMHEIKSHPAVSVLLTRFTEK